MKILWRYWQLLRDYMSDDQRAKYFQDIHVNLINYSIWTFILLKWCWRKSIRKYPIFGHIWQRVCVQNIWFLLISHKFLFTVFYIIYNCDIYFNSYFRVSNHIPTAIYSIFCIYVNLNSAKLACKFNSYRKIYFLRIIYRKSL